MRPLYIFDLDGTLADGDHRLHHILKDEKDWDKFFNACERDTPIPATIAVYHALKATGAETWLFTGRSDMVADKTFRWLRRTGLRFEVIRQRDKDDRTNDDELKEKWLNEMHEFDRQRLVAVFEDRSRVVDMWRRNDVHCFQVDKGDF